MKKIICIMLLFLFACKKDINNKDKKILKNLGKKSFKNIKEFDFSNPSQLSELPSFGEDPSYIENGKLKSVIKKNKHKGLGRKFYFKDKGKEPDESEMEFTIYLADNFQKNGASNEAGKFSGFEGIYDNSAGWGGKKVITQRSWSVRIAHGRENKENKIPIGLYVYHFGMKGKYGTTEVLNFYLNKKQTYKFKLYIKLNEINKKNGILTFFVDDKKIYNSNSWIFRNDKTVHIRSVWLDTYIGGLTPSKYDTYILMDNLKIKW